MRNLLIKSRFYLGNLRGSGQRSSRRPYLHRSVSLSRGTQYGSVSLVRSINYGSVSLSRGTQYGSVPLFSFTQYGSVRLFRSINYGSVRLADKFNHKIPDNVLNKCKLFQKTEVRYFNSKKQNSISRYKSMPLSKKEQLKKKKLKQVLSPNPSGPSPFLAFGGSVF